jgi:transporter family protein
MIILLSLTAAFLLGCIAIFTKKGLAYGTVRQSVAYTFGADFALLMVLLGLTRPTFSISGAGAGWFILDGLLAVVGAAILFQSVKALGPAIAYPIKNAAPIPALLLAVIFLGERPGLLVVTGALLAAVGIVILSLQPTKGGIPWNLDTLVSISSALLFAIDNIVRQLGLQEVSSPLYGIVLAVGVSLICAVAWSGFSADSSLLQIKPRAALFFSLAGLAQGAALVCIYTALQEGMVSVVVPLYNLSPLFVLILSWLFLKGVEKITGRIIFGTLIIVAGVVLIGIYH